ASRACVYLWDPLARQQVEAALAAAPVSTVDISVVEVAPAYVAGEETSAVQAINGGPAVPTDKPPRPFEEGVAGLPTLVSNVETLANLPVLQRIGAAAYREIGTAGCPGTFMLTLTTPGGAGLYEVPLGTTLREVLAVLGEDPAVARSVLAGGYFAGLLGPRALDLPLDYDAYAAAGSGLGCGALVVLDEAVCPVSVAAAVLGYFDRENAGQ